MGDPDVNFEDENMVLEAEVTNEAAEQELNLAQDEDDKLNTLADLIVEKLLDSEHFTTLSATSFPKNLRSDKARSERDSERQSKRDRNSYMEDLIDAKRKPLGLSKKSQFADHYLKTIKLIYSELVAELGGKFFVKDLDDVEIDVSTFLRNFKYREGITDLLLRIETFVLVLAYSPIPAYIFDGESEEDLDKESLNQVKARITALGYELLYLLDNLETIKKMNNGLYLSGNVQLFISFMIDYQFQPNRRTGKGRDLMRQEITSHTLNELNYILIDLKRAIEKGEYDRPKLYIPRTFTRSKEAASVKAKWNAEGFKENLGKYSKRLKSAIDHFRTYKSTSISLYRMRIWLDSQDRDEVRLEKFKTFFGELNKKASKSGVGFKGYLNFFYIWDISGDKWFQDIVLVIDNETLLIMEDKQHGSIRNITQEFEEFAAKYLDHRAEVIFAGQMKPQLHIEPIPLMYHLDLPSQLLIDIGDRDSWKIFENSILPFFLYHEFLELNLDEEISSRFGRGNNKKLSKIEVVGK